MEAKPQIMPSEPSPEWEPYVRAWRERRRKAAQIAEKRRTNATGKLCVLAQEIKRRAPSTREICVFGSVLKKGMFRLDSDIDIIVKGLSEREAVELAEEIVHLPEFGDIRIDLHRIEDLPEHIRLRALKEGAVIDE